MEEGRVRLTQAQTLASVGTDPHLPPLIQPSYVRALRGGYYELINQTRLAWYNRLV